MKAFLCIAVVLLLFPLAALADCTFSVTSMNFGNYDVFNGSPTDSTATLTYSCSNPAVSPTLSASAGGASSFSARRMVSGSSNLSYNLFVDSARTAIFGDGTGGTATVSCAIASNQTAIIYGRIPAGQNLPVGAYSDTVTITLNF